MGPCLLMALHVLQTNLISISFSFTFFRDEALPHFHYRERKYRVSQLKQQTQEREGERGGAQEHASFRHSRTDSDLDSCHLIQVDPKNPRTRQKRTRIQRRLRVRKNVRSNIWNLQAVLSSSVATSSTAAVNIFGA